MLYKYTKFYISLTKHINLTKDDILNILHTESVNIIRLLWGEEYVEFIFEDEKIYPIEGSTSIIGFSPHHKVSPVQHNIDEFLELIKTCSKFILIPNDDKTISEECEKFFDVVRIHRVEDYSSMVTELEKYGYVETVRSTNIMAVDERKFMLTEKAYSALNHLIIEGKDKKINILRYANIAYEVDTLGTSLFSELTDIIIDLHKLLKE